MATLTYVVLYPEPLPADLPINRQKAEEQFSRNTKVVRETFKTLDDVPEHLAKTVNVLMIYKLRVTAAHLQRFPKLKGVVRLGVGFDGLDIEAIEAQGATAHNTPAYGSEVVASHAVTMATCLANQTIAYHDELREPGPITWDATATTPARAPWDMTFCVLGFGRIGRRAAEIARDIGYKKVYYYDIKEFDPVEGIQRLDSLDQLLHLADVLSLHIPYTKETKNIIGLKQIDNLVAGAIIVNTSRGGVLDLDAVRLTMKSNQLRGVCLDVLPDEPPTDENMPDLVKDYRNKNKYLNGRMILTPHAASHSPQSFENIHTMSAQTAVAILAGITEQDRVRPEEA